jgi:hypothetical protein
MTLIDKRFTGKGACNTIDKVIEPMQKCKENCERSKRLGIHEAVSEIRYERERK